MKLLRTVIQKSLIFFVHVYQYTLSPFLGSNCRHTPTCSNYTIEAIELYGPLKGSWMGAKRIARCNPWGTSGYDPVPPKEGHNHIH